MVSEVFASSFDAELYYAVLIAWALLFVVERAIMRAAGERRILARSDRGSSLVILLGFGTALVLSSRLTPGQLTPLPTEFFYVGLSMMALGMLVRVWAVMTLRGFFSYTVQIKEGHRVIQSGPYRFVRHPAYTGSLLTILGIGLALQSWGEFLALALVFGLAFGYRIRVEEKALVAALGNDYVAYSKKVKRLIPYVL